MGGTTDHTKALVELLRRQKIARIEELKEALGTTSRMTVFRALKKLGYRTSYSHGGMFYTLDKIAQFDEHGLWSHEDVWFSKLGTLATTAERFVIRSEGGYFVRELDVLLHVNTKKTLHRLVANEKIGREKVMGWYLYCAIDSVKRREQLRARQLLESELILSYGLKQPRVSVEDLKGAIVLFYGLLNEKERRLFAGLESLKSGYGGDRRIANLLGIDVHTVARARKELLEAEIDSERIRKAGGGRKAIKKKSHT